MTPSDTPAGDTPTVIDPRSLGRPVHLLPGFAMRFGADLGDFLRLGPNRRYGTNFEVAGATMVPMPEAAPPARWMVFGGPTGRIAVSIGRNLVLRLLQCRYGLHEKPEADDPTMPVTASEERLARKLGLQLVSALMHRVQDGAPAPGGAGGVPAAGAGLAQPIAATEAPAWVAESVTALGEWRLAVRLSEAAQGVDATVCFSMDEAWIRILLGQLARDRAPAREADGAQPLASRLKVRLVARLLQQRITLGEILALRVGDVLPVNLQSTDILVKDSRLFTASVAEHKGRLWLTEFNDT